MSVMTLESPGTRVRVSAVHRDSPDWLAIEGEMVVVFSHPSGAVLRWGDGYGTVKVKADDVLEWEVVG